MSSCQLTASAFAHGFVLCYLICSQWHKTSGMSHLQTPSLILIITTTYFWTINNYSMQMQIVNNALPNKGNNSFCIIISPYLRLLSLYVAIQNIGTSQTTLSSRLGTSQWTRQRIQSSTMWVATGLRTLMMGLIIGRSQTLQECARLGKD